MKIVVTVLATLAVLVAGALILVFSGAPDVSALHSASPLVDWFLVTTREHSIEARAEKIQVPDLSGEGRLAEGAEHYHEMCADCHGAPGVDAEEFAQGLHPAAPDLTRHRFEGEEAAEAFWIIQNGIRMTGMPGFGATHTDEQIWDIVAFLQRLRAMSPAEYARWAEEAEAAEAGEGHHHGEAGEAAAATTAAPAGGEDEHGGHHHDDDSHHDSDRDR